MESKGILSISEVNALPVENFEWFFGNAIEHCPEAASTVAEKRPFSSSEDLKSAFDDYLDKLENAGNFYRIFKINLTDIFVSFFIFRYCFLIFHCYRKRINFIETSRFGW